MENVRRDGLAEQRLDPTDLVLSRVQRASDQVAGQLRGMILSGSLENGTRLPTEAEFASKFGVSRTTIREALQVLAAEGLTHTRKGGVRGGTFVAVPSRDRVMTALRSGVTMLSHNDDLTLGDLLEMRELLEVPAAGFAAERGTADDFALLLEAAQEPLEAAPPADRFRHTASFHGLVLMAAHNPLLLIAAQPIQDVLLADRLTPEGFGPRLRAEIHQHHGDIAAAIASRDADAARRLMHEHLAWLRPRHEQLVRRKRSRRP